MRTTLALVLVASLAACAAPAPSVGEPDVGTVGERFTSAHARLVELELDGLVFLETPDPAEIERRIQAQLLYLVGQLNAVRSVGQHPSLRVTPTLIAGLGGDVYRVSYEAHLPVAWGEDTPPATFEVTLPVRAGEADQITFASRYAPACADPEGGLRGGEDAGRMFLFFRPRRAGCTFAASDVVSTTARLRPAVASSHGKYPEYHRVWEDGALDVVAIFGREQTEPTADDAGARAHEAFLTKSEALLRSHGALVRRQALSPAGAVRLDGELAPGRRVRVETILVPAHLSPERGSFDAWYEPRSAQADVIVYSGHAGLGDNVRALARKGTFTPGKYLLMVENGCDTLAYLDRTLADRRATLNPDDPAGTKHLDTVTNVLGGYFHTGDETTLTLLRAFVDVLDTHERPRTYEEILAEIDPTQIPVVTGEEDNAFDPAMLGADARPPPAIVSAAPPPPVVTGSNAAPAEESGRPSASCSASRAPAPRGLDRLGLLGLLAALVVYRTRSRRRSFS